MFFLASAKHTPRDCPAANGVDDARYNESVGKLAPPYMSEQSARAEQHGVRVHCVAFNTPGHELFWILESDDSSKVANYLKPIKPMSVIQITPLTMVGFPLVPA